MPFSPLLNSCLIFILFFLGWLPPSWSLVTEEYPLPPQQKTWSGHLLRSDVGTSAIFNEGQKTKWAPLFELGYEFGSMVSQHFYLGIDATWILFFPDSFRPQHITLNGGKAGHRVSPLMVILIPILQGHLGFRFKDETLVTLGPAYFWGLITTVRRPLNPSFFWEFKTLWFLDRLLFDQGIHDLFLTVGLGFRF